MIGLIFAGMTAATLAALLFPLLRSRTVIGASRADHEITVYRDQLAELDREIERDLMTAEQAGAARLEIQRRILASAESQHTTVAPDNRRTNAIIAAIIALFVSLGSWQLYAHLGAPGLPDRPFAERQNDPDMQMNATAELIAAMLEAQPDVEGYKRLADMYYALRRFDRATVTYQKAADMDANDAATWAKLGESIVMANDGDVVMEAQNAFKTALAHDKNEPRSRFYMGLAEAQIGKLKKAVAVWRDLEQNAPPDAPWLPMVKENIAAYAKQGGFDPASVTPTPP